MNALSSTSSSERRPPRSRWREVLGGGIAMLLVSMCLMEAGLAWRGIRPNPTESVRAWVRERGRADTEGTRALALVGSSRILLDVDLQLLRHEAGLEPVQLGIEGNSSVPVLLALAADPSFRGSVLVDLDFETLLSPPPYDAATAYERLYQRHLDAPVTYAGIEGRLTDMVHSSLRSYADGTRPWTALRTRLLQRPDPVQYLKVLPDRAILADYSRTPMPYLYYFRAWRSLNGAADLPAGRTYRQIGDLIESGIARLHAQDDSPLLQLLPVLQTAVARIRAKGGQVYFAVLPRSGYIREMEDRRFPRRLFLDKLTAAIPAATVDFEDVPALSSFSCPDGSHLDYRERQGFTHALVQALRLEAVP